MNINTLVKTGPVALMEFRGETLETVKFSKEGKAQEMVIHHVSCEYPNGIHVTVSPRYAYGEVRRKLGYEKGQMILVQVIGLEEKRGVHTMLAGDIVPYSTEQVISPPETPAPGKGK